MAACSASLFSFAPSTSPSLFLKSSRPLLLQSRASSWHSTQRLRALPRVRALAQPAEPPTADVAAIGDAALAGRAVGGTPVFEEALHPVEVLTRNWKWEGHSIRYQQAGSSGPALLLIHGFGANCDHWRKNLPILGQSHRVYAIDLLGYGYSDKPNPRGLPPNTIYTFETWARQSLAFISEIIGEPPFIICNSVGGIVGLQAALDCPSQVQGLLLLNVSLRQLHIKKQQWFLKPFVKALQTTLRTTNIGQMFFASVATPKSVKQILQQCYYDKSQVTDELVNCILEPGLQPGAVDVFLDFICYSGGPLPEEMLPLVQCPVVIGWGEEDPWEPIELGKVYGNFTTVEEFVSLPGVGHCPQDEAPHLVNPMIEKFVAKHA